MTNEELIPIAKTGDKQAIQTLYDNNIGIMHMLIFENHISKQDRDDLLQECYFVLINCINRYDANKDILFISYLSQAITWMIQRKKNLMKKHDNDISLYSKINDAENIELIDVIKDSKSEEFIDDYELSYLQSEVQRILAEIEQPARDLTFENLGKKLSVKYLSRKYSITERDVFNHINKARKNLRRNKRLRILGQEYGLFFPGKYKVQYIEHFAISQQEELKKLRTFNNTHSVLFTRI